MPARVPPILIAVFTALVLRSAAAENAPQIAIPVDENDLVALAGNTRPEAAPANDRGLVPETMPLAHLQLLLRRSRP